LEKGVELKIRICLDSGYWIPELAVGIFALQRSQVEDAGVE
jgi:hypothetical protein